MKIRHIPSTFGITEEVCCIGQILLHYDSALSYGCFIGWIIGSIDSEDYRLRRLAVDLRISVVNVEYRYE